MALYTQQEARKVNVDDPNLRLSNSEYIKSVLSVPLFLLVLVGVWTVISWLPHIGFGLPCTKVEKLIHEGKYLEVKEYVEGMDIPEILNSRGDTPVTDAIVSKDPRMFRLIAPYFGPEFAFRERWLLAAMSVENKEVIDYCLKILPDPSRAGPLHWAAECGNREIVDLLLKKGYDPTVHEMHRETLTPDERAWHEGHYELSRYLAKVARKWKDSRKT